MTVTTPEEDRLLDELRRAVDAAPAKVREIEVGVSLSIALGKQRLAASCGGCSTPLEFRGIPARTNLHLGSPYRLVLDRSERAE